MFIFNLKSEFKENDLALTSLKIPLRISQPKQSQHMAHWFIYAGVVRHICFKITMGCRDTACKEIICFGQDKIDYVITCGGGRVGVNQDQQGCFKITCHFNWCLFQLVQYCIRRTRSSYYNIFNWTKCVLFSFVLDSQQFSYLISGEYGRCYNEPKSLRVSGRNKIYNYQTHAGKWWVNHCI